METYLDIDELIELKGINRVTFYRQFNKGRYKKTRYVKTNRGRSARKIQVALSCLMPAEQTEYYKRRNKNQLVPVSKAGLVQGNKELIKSERHDLAICDDQEKRAVLRKN